MAVFLDFSQFKTSCSISPAIKVEACLYSSLSTKVKVENKLIKIGQLLLDLRPVNISLKIMEQMGLLGLPGLPGLPGLQNHELYKGRSLILPLDPDPLSLILTDPTHAFLINVIASKTYLVYAKFIIQLGQPLIVRLHSLIWCVIHASK